jgi:hypothetical protein
MASLISLLVEPIYRIAYGAPLNGQATPLTRDHAGENRSPGAFVVVVDGVGGLDLCGTALRYVLGAAKLPYTIQIVSWGHGFGRWFADLTDVANRDEKAHLVAESVRSYRSSRPLDPIYMVAKSGGSGVVAKALEELDDHQVERVVMLAPALSPSYDLSRALRAVRREIVVFWSPLDLIILGAGTHLFGTIDRIKTASAGMVGFRVPKDGQLDENKSQQYDKLRQIRWRPRMAATGYIGGHFGPDSPLFLRKYVVPLLQDVEP